MKAYVHFIIFYQMFLRWCSLWHCITHDSFRSCDSAMFCGSISFELSNKYFTVVARIQMMWWCGRKHQAFLLIQKLGLCTYVICTKYHVFKELFNIFMDGNVFKCDQKVPEFHMYVTFLQRTRIYITEKYTLSPIEQHCKLSKLSFHVCFQVKEYMVCQKKLILSRCLPK